MKISFFSEDPKYSNESFYAIQVMLSCIQLAASEVLSVEEAGDSLLIYYGEKSIERKKTIIIKPGTLFSETYGLPNTTYHWDSNSIYEGIPFLFGTGKIEIGSDFVKSDIDLIQSAFYILTNYEEWVDKASENWDKHGRYYVEHKAVYQMCRLERAIVNEYANDLLLQWIHLLTGEFALKTVQSAYLNLTHDVDYPYELEKKTFPHRVYQYILWKLGIIKSNKISEGFRILREVEDKYGMVSTWYFKTGGITDFDLRYDLNEKSVLNLIVQLQKDNCEIGFHYSYNAACDGIAFKKECERLRNITNIEKIGGRNHYLRKTIPESVAFYEDCKLIYDSTAGEATRAGFLQGICTPYLLFDLREKKVTNVMEIPLIVMDGTLREESYQNLDCETAIAFSCRLIDEVKKFGGVFTLLWHNTSVNTDKWIGWEQVYDRVLSYAKDRGLICKCSMEIQEIYRGINRGE